jgi:hypothetical protein
VPPHTTRNNSNSRQTRRAPAALAGAIRLEAPRTTPITDAQYQQAVQALASMIEDWWTRQQHTTP